MRKPIRSNHDPRGVMEHTFIIGFDQADLTHWRLDQTWKFEMICEKVNAASGELVLKC